MSATAAAVPPELSSRSRSRSTAGRSRTWRTSSLSQVRTVTPSGEEPPVAEGCICLRDYKIIFCKICGWNGKGRVRMECPVHTRTLYLLDIEQCPKCRAYPPILTEC